MDKKLFEQGETIQEYLGSLTTSKEKFNDLLDNCQLTEDQSEKFASMPDNINVMVIAEEWSGDVMYNLPVFIKVSQTCSWNVRIFRRDKYPELILPYRKDGLYHSIPVFVFFDQNFIEIARWIERPAEATRIIDEESLKLRRRLREENKDAWRQEMIRELAEII